MECARAIDYASSLGDDTEGDCSRSPTDEVRLAVHAVGQAIVACESDRMAVPELLSEASGRMLFLFMLGERPGARRIARPDPARPALAVCGRSCRSVVDQDTVALCSSQPRGSSELDQLCRLEGTGGEPPK